MLLYLLIYDQLKYIVSKLTSPDETIFSSPFSLLPASFIELRLGKTLSFVSDFVLTANASQQDGYLLLLVHGLLANMWY